jgi:hypothetical protein
MTKELKINIRNIHNIHKKLAASSKADAVIANNPDQTFGDLVASKTINAYQKAQVLYQAQPKQTFTQFSKAEKDLDDRLRSRKRICSNSIISTRPCRRGLARQPSQPSTASACAIPPLSSPPITARNRYIKLCFLHVPKL